jgi:GntR family phosphonate transport system transcriptional regulator
MCRQRRSVAGRCIGSMTDSMERGGGIALWRQIAERLRAEIAAGLHAAEARLPAEGDLAQRFGVNRHTLRRAIAALAAEGIVRVDQGRGTFVEARRIPYPIQRRTRFSEAVSANARLPAGQLLAHRVDEADGWLAQRLEVPEGTALIRLDTLSRADGVPVSIATHWVPASRFGDIVAVYERTGSFTLALAAHGVDDYARRSTRVTARPAEPHELEHLDLPAGSVVLVTENVDVDPAGVPVQTGRTRFAAERVELVIWTL